MFSPQNRQDWLSSGRKAPTYSCNAILGRRLDFDPESGFCLRRNTRTYLKFLTFECRYLVPCCWHWALVRRVHADHGPLTVDDCKMNEARLWKKGKILGTFLSFPVDLLLIYDTYRNVFTSKPAGLTQQWSKSPDILLQCHSGQKAGLWPQKWILSPAKHKNVPEVCDLGVLISLVLWCRFKTAINNTKNAMTLKLVGSLKVSCFWIDLSKLRESKVYFAENDITLDKLRFGRN